MKKETKDNLIGSFIGVAVVIGLIGGFFLFMQYMFWKSDQELHSRIIDNINLSKPFTKVLSIETDFICCAEDMYFVTILAEHETLGPQYIYHFEYDDSTDILYYDDNIAGVGVRNH